MPRTTHFRQTLAPGEAMPAFEPLGAGTLVDRTATGLRLQTPRAVVEVTALAPDLFRVGVFDAGRPVRYDSAAIARAQWPAIPVYLSEDADAVRLETEAAIATLTLDPVRLSFSDQHQRPIAVDEPARGMGFRPPTATPDQLVDALGRPACVYKRHVPGTHYFGCGERTGGLDKTGTLQVFWNEDPPLGHTAGLNNLYTSVPFVLALHAGQAWGLFLDSAYRIEFDLAREDPTCCGFGVDGGPLVYYVFTGPTPRAVLERYTELTGRMPLPPRWALGNQQSRWGYASAAEVLDLARTFRDRAIPLDVIYLDIDYMDGYRVFTWDTQRFPDPAGLVRQLQDLGVKLVTILDPGVKVDQGYAVYTGGREAEVFCKTASGAEYHNVVWPGLCAFPDFTSPRTRAWWGDHLVALVDVGVAGIWCDMNEPSMFIPTASTLPPDTVHTGDGEPLLHIQVHNLYGMLMARATHEALLQQRPDRRPLVISRAGYAGLQRYALHWTGDNSSWWEHVWMSMPQLQNLGLSGYAWVGVDIGGFWGDCDGELLTRWTEFGIFQPFCRNHSARGTRPQEPWAFGEPWQGLMRTLLQLRQRLVPYLYSRFDEAHRTGAPVLRPLLFEWPDDPTTYAADDEFLVGSDLLVAPIARPGVEYRHVYIPRGAWVDYWRGRRLAGPAHELAHAPLGQPALYVRANTPIPLWPESAYDGQAAPDPLTWLIFAAAAEPGSSELYEDAGDGFSFEQGDFARVRATCRISASRIVIELGPPAGTFVPPRGHLEIDIRGLEQPATVRVDGIDHTDWQYQAQAGRLVVHLAADRAPHTIDIAAALR